VTRGETSGSERGQRTWPGGGPRGTNIHTPGQNLGTATRIKTREVGGNVLLTRGRSNRSCGGTLELRSAFHLSRGERSGNDLTGERHKERRLPKIKRKTTFRKKRRNRRGTECRPQRGFVEKRARGGGFRTTQKVAMRENNLTAGQ